MLNKGKAVLFMALACVMLISAGAFAGISIPAQISSELGAREVLGDQVFFSYYDIRTMEQDGPGLITNYFTIVNTDDDEYVQGHLRVRTGGCSVELLDFDVIMSPNDVFTFQMKQDSEGNTVFVSCDTGTLTHSGFDNIVNGCVSFDTKNDPNMLSLIQVCDSCADGSEVDAAAALVTTRTGYIEFIGEVKMSPDDVDDDWFDNHADDDPQPCLEADLEDGEYTSWDWDEDECSSREVNNVLFGKVYYVSLDGSANLIKLATANATSSPDAVDGMILHKPCYEDEGNCLGELDDPTGSGYAYGPASLNIVSDVLQGAVDMNYCFYNDLKITVGGEITDQVINRVGAAATFGPTVADFRNSSTDTRNDGSSTSSETEAILHSINDEGAKANAVTHYWNLNESDQTRVVLTFPIQHFLSQKIQVTQTSIFDDAETFCEPPEIPSTKFISPGLPTPSDPLKLQGEVTEILAYGDAVCHDEDNNQVEFIEGWIAINLEAIEDGTSTENYTPLAVGLVSNWGNDRGANSIAISPLHWKGSSN